MPLKEKVVTAFEHRFGALPALVAQAPGRVNLIGEHTDYSDGFVLPMAIDRAVWIALRPRLDRRVVGYALDLGDRVTFSLDRLEKRSAGWGEYVKGVAWALHEAGYPLVGWEGVIAGDVPIGAGLSSSAALEMATICAFSAVSDFSCEATAMARIGQRAENEWVGVSSGIMDQLVSAAGLAAHSLLIDCRSLEIDPVPLPDQIAVIVLDTTTRRGLVDSVYNERRAQCEAAARRLEVPALRDVTLERFRAEAERMDGVVRRRARHVISENARTLNAADAMRRGDVHAMGRLMNESHASLRDDFEVSSQELNAIVACARQQDGCYGARLTGAGLGGCAIALVRADAVKTFIDLVARCYKEVTGLTPDLYVCSASSGASVQGRGTGQL
jgi:galactokinase